MYVPKARKLSSGSWQVRVTIGGKTTSIVRPTKKQAETAAVELKTGIKKVVQSEHSLSQAMDLYINKKEEKLSPSTIRGYRQIRAHRLQKLMHRKIRDITQAQWQDAIDEEKKVVSPKTIKNTWRLVRTVLKAEGVPCPEVELDRVIVPDLNFLSFTEIERLQKVIKGSPYEIAILLALSSLRLSEVLDVRIDDINLEENTIDVHGAAVLDSDGKLVHKAENKNQTSRRTIPFIIPQLREAIQSRDWKPGEYLVTFHPNSLWKAVNRLCDEAGVTRCGMHDLRRSFVSYCVHLNVPLEYIRVIGGWANDTVVRQVYMKIADEDMKIQADKIVDFFSKLA